MNQKSFATAFEARLKPMIARELNISPLSQCYNGDFVTPYGNIIELKIRKINDGENCEGFVASKKQYARIRKFMCQTLIDKDGVSRPPTFTYAFLPYSYKKKISSVNSIDEVIKDMKISKAFIVDNRFIPEHDRSGEDSRFYRVLMKTLDKNVQQKRKVRLLDSEIFLNIVGYDNYLPELATRIF